MIFTGLSRAVGNVSGYRCVSDCVDPGVVSSVLAQSHTFVDIDHKIISKVILLPFSDLRWFVVSYKPKYVHEVLVTSCSS